MVVRDVKQEVSTMTNADGESSTVLAALAAICVAVAMSMVAREHCWIQFTPELRHMPNALGSPAPVEEGSHERDQTW